MGPSPRQVQDCVLIYDGRCRLCTATKAVLERWPGAPISPVRYLPYDSPEAAQLLGNRYQRGRPEVAYLVEPGGRLADGLESFLRVLPRFRGGGPLAFFLRLPIIHGLAIGAYALIARNRYRWFGAVRKQ